MNINTFLQWPGCFTKQRVEKSTVQRPSESVRFRFPAISYLQCKQRLISTQGCYKHVYFGIYDNKKYVFQHVCMFQYVFLVSQLSFSLFCHLQVVIHKGATASHLILQPSLRLENNSYGFAFEGFD